MLWDAAAVLEAVAAVRKHWVKRERLEYVPNRFGLKGEIRYNPDGSASWS